MADFRTVKISLKDERFLDLRAKLADAVDKMYHTGPFGMRIMVSHALPPDEIIVVSGNWRVGQAVSWHLVPRPAA